MFARCCDQNRPSCLRRCGLLLTTWFTAVLLIQTAIAHTPFESNARVTVFADHIEAAVTSGMGLAAALLQETGIDPTQARGFGGAKAAPEISQRIIGLEADGQIISAESVKVLGDGLEAMLVVTFPRPAAGYHQTVRQLRQPCSRWQCQSAGDCGRTGTNAWLSSRHQRQQRHGISTGGTCSGRGRY
jgi:hypothetical protein